MGVAYSVGEVDHLYTFFAEWSPNMSVTDTETHCPPQYLTRERHKNCYLTMERDMAVIGKLLSHPGSSNWEIVKVNDSKRRISLCSSEESEAEYQEEVDDGLPILTDHSQLLEDHHLERLGSHMPARAQGYPWQLVYSTAIHGSSLKTLYRNLAGLESPVLLVIKDMQKKVFGAFSSAPFKVSKYCYGTGETFLFSFNPDLQIYRWSGKNTYFVSGNLESLQIGGGGSGFALWLDADLYHGASFSCPTFQNAPLSTHEDFLVQDLEVWTITN